MQTDPRIFLNDILESTAASEAGVDYVDIVDYH